jgi:two-component system sensor histidine kinase RegB
MCTGLLFFTGGPSNPFSFLYLVQIALAATTLRAAWTWALTTLALGCSAVLFVWHRPLPAGASHEQYMELHLRGMWVAFGVAASFIVYFLLRVRRALAQRETELARSRLIAARQERLASLATLAAGAAHELSTPLATIAVVMKELQRRASLVEAGASVMDDLRLVREQVDRCRGILERMSSDAGETIGEGTVATTVREVVESVVRDLPSAVPVHMDYWAGEAALRLRVPPRAFGQALRGIVKNAQEASPPGGTVALRVQAVAAGLSFEVRDQGPGIPAAVLDRVGEPFFTTKPTGRGMGLGVFLARTTLERLGGQLRLASAASGTTASLELPSSLVEHGSTDAPSGAAP